MRWRPAKAFLLDERNALVHELTLDPSCTISLPEAIAAGALNANGVGVRVSRYHGQAVRAGGMALLVLSNGPPEPETVELARQLLLGTLARLRDSARDRLDLARTEEARLDSERRRVAAWTADVQARERGVAGLHEATVVSQGRIATNAAAAASRAQALSSGEASLAARETAVAARENEIVARAADADARITREK